MTIVPGVDLNADERKTLDRISQGTNSQRNGDSVVQSLIHKGYAEAAPDGPCLTDKGRRMLKPPPKRRQSS